MEILTDMPVSKNPECESARVIAISSGKGGVGKSTLAVNLSIALAQTGKKVCLFDADTNLANINILLGVSPLHTLEHFLKNNLSLNEVITRGPGGIDIIAGASGVSEFIQLSNLQQKKLTQGLRLLENNYQYLLVDTAAGIDQTNLSFILAAPYLLLTITREPTSLTDAFSLLRVLKKSQFNRPVLVIVNMSKSQHAAQATFKRFKMAVNKYLQLQRIFLVGSVLADKNVPVSILKQQPILLNSPDSPASKCITNICQRLLMAFNKEDKEHKENIKDKNNTPFSDYFADLSADDKTNEVLDDVEFEPIQGSIQCKQEKVGQEQPFIKSKKSSDIFSDSETEYAGLLQASYSARLLDEKIKNP